MHFINFATLILELNNNYHFYTEQRTMSMEPEREEFV